MSAANRMTTHAGLAAIALTMALAGCGQPAAPAADTETSAAPAPAAAAAPQVTAASEIEAGRYIVSITGCNDCHTPGYIESNGANPPEAERLTGSPVGYSGPWGVSYASNLRLFVQTLSADEFVAVARAGQGRPPMPWPALMNMSEADLRAVYAYLTHLGPAGSPAPAATSPGVAPTTPHIVMVPVGPG